VGRALRRDALRTPAPRRTVAEGDRIVGRKGRQDNGGKTRLATRFGWSALASFAGGVWFCDLTATRGLDGILHAVAQGLDVPLGKEDPVVQLGHAIARRGRCLVVLDNFEQVARHADSTVGRWLSAAPDARFLATTREVLGLPGEEVLALAPLATQDGSELFVRRAKAANPDFEPNAEDKTAITTLVRLLDGLPLAIELAAVRVRVMPPRAVLARMNEHRCRSLAGFTIRIRACACARSSIARPMRSITRRMRAFGRN
jgi:predicted ATPase